MYACYSSPTNGMHTVIVKGHQWHSIHCWISLCIPPDIENYMYAGYHIYFIIADHVTFSQSGVYNLVRWQCINNTYCMGRSEICWVISATIIFSQATVEGKHSTQVKWLISLNHDIRNSSSTCNNSLVPRSRPAFRCLQYRKVERVWLSFPTDYILNARCIWQSPSTS